MITAKTIGTGGLGRFGNQLFTIAGCIGIAVKSGQPYGFPKWMNFDNKIFGDEITDFSTVFINPLPEWIDIPYQDYGYFWGYREIILPTGNWNIDAHMQSEKFFRHCIDTVRHYFRMFDEPAQNDMVAIHYRAGDYSPDPNGYHPRCSKEYYESAMSQFPEGTKFILFSDGSAEWINMMGNPDVQVSKGNYIEDFRLMKRCKSFIVANSSFSMMAAILAEHPDKKIIAPSRWFGPDAGLDTRDCYPEGAIII